MLTALWTDADRGVPRVGGEEHDFARADLQARSVTYHGELPMDDDQPLLVDISVLLTVEDGFADHSNN